jgi:hypothetical protein
MTKYKIGFTIQAETLFAMMAKMLPIDDVKIQEFIEPPLEKQSKVAQQVIAALGAPQKEKPIKLQKHFYHPSGKTCQNFILEFLQKRPSATWSEMSHFLVSLGYNKSSVNNAVSRLVEKKFIERVTTGVYRLAGKQSKTINHM